MKTHSALLRSRSLLIAAVLLSASAMCAADDGITSAESIKRSINPPLTRSAFGPRKDTRFGYVVTGTGTSRSVNAVEVTVQADANISLPNIQFKLGSTEPADAASVAQLEELARALRDLPAGGASFLIEGHTCSRGSDEINNRLSAERADYVRAFLIERGVSSTVLQSIGYGATEARLNIVSPEAGETALAPYRKVMIHKKLQ
jgi:outer membrane protein OmpA-like peptidoglycan-associated protein